MEEGCDNCDNCLHPKEKFEGKSDVLLSLKAILGVQEKFKSEHIANVLSGNANSAVKTYNHHHSEYFGAGKEKDVKYWNAVLRQALIAGLITKDIENYGLLRLTEAGHEFIKKPYSMMLTQDHDFDIAPEEGVATGGGGTGAVDDELLHILKDLRKKMARELKSSSLCDFPGSFAGRHGHPVPGKDGGAAEYCGCGYREGKEVRGEICGCNQGVCGG